LFFLVEKDEASQRLFIAGHKPARMVVLNARDGKKVASFSIPELNDDT
jgi:hypothetical protein